MNPRKETIPFWGNTDTSLQGTAVTMIYFSIQQQRLQFL